MVTAEPPANRLRRYGRQNQHGSRSRPPRLRCAKVNWQGKVVRRDPPLTSGFRCSANPLSTDLRDAKTVTPMWNIAGLLKLLSLEQTRKDRTLRNLSVFGILLLTTDTLLDAVKGCVKPFVSG